MVARWYHGNENHIDGKGQMNNSSVHIFCLDQNDFDYVLGVYNDIDIITLFNNITILTITL